MDYTHLECKFHRASKESYSMISFNLIERYKCLSEVKRYVVKIKKLADYYLKRIPDMFLVVFAFSISVVSEEKINILDLNYNIRMFVLIILLTIPIAILDYILQWYREKHLKE